MEEASMPISWPRSPAPMAWPNWSRLSEAAERPPLCVLQKGTDLRLSWRPGASMMQHTMVVSSSSSAYMILVIMVLSVALSPVYRAVTHLEATLELQELGQHWQMAHAADPKQQAAVLPREMMAPITRRIRN